MGLVILVYGVNGIVHDVDPALEGSNLKIIED